tara:strand:+ start:2246 stop:2500 length:255 start_codon:yes stop_codon:yes gene_type:complete
MYTQIINGKIRNIKRLNNSYNGNPNFKFDVEVSNGHLIPVSTMNDAGINYILGGHWEDSDIEIVLKVNRLSNKLIDIAKAEVSA